MNAKGSELVSKILELCAENRRQGLYGPYEVLIPQGNLTSLLEERYYSEAPEFISPPGRPKPPKPDGFDVSIRERILRLEGVRWIVIAAVPYLVVRPLSSATKLNPGDFDCYQNALPNEPMFQLLARDPVAACMVEIWRGLRARTPSHAVQFLNEAFRIMENKSNKMIPLDDKKSVEAEQHAGDMTRFRREVCLSAAPLCNQRCTLPKGHERNHQFWDNGKLVSGWY